MIFIEIINNKKMELRQLEYFVASAETGSFTEAAKLCFITQGTLSQQIKQLEEYLGCQLFDRVGKRISLSEVGKEFLPYAKQTLRDAEIGRQVVGDLQKLEKGTLRIGSTYGLSAVLTQTILRFHALYPQITYEVIYRKADELVELLHQQEIDLALSFNLLTADERIEEVPLFDSTLCAVVSKEHPLAKFKRMPLAVLADYPIAVPFRGMNARRLYDEFVVKNKLKIAPTIEISEIYTLIRLVKESGWIAIIADCTILGVDGVVAIPFETGRIEMQATLLQRKGIYNRRAVSRFIEVLKEMAVQE